MSTSSLPLETLGPVEHLGAADAGELLTLQRAAFVTEAQAYGDPHLPPLTQTLAELLAELGLPTVLALGVRAGSRLIGSVRLHRAEDGVSTLHRLVVAPDQQGRGLGRLLLAAAEDEARATSHTLRLWTGAASPGNVHLYTSSGYVEEHLEHLPTITFVHLAKRLTPSGAAPPAA